MLHAPFTSDLKVKRMALMGGSGDTKDKLIVVVLVVLIAVAGFALAMSIFKKDKRTVGPDKYTMLCTNAQCKNEWVMTREEVNKSQAASPTPMEMEMIPRFVCPKCGQKTGYRETQCPACKKFFLDNRAKSFLRMKTEEPEKCPHCGVVLTEWYAKHGK